MVSCSSQPFHSVSKPKFQSLLSGFVTLTFVQFVNFSLSLHMQLFITSKHSFRPFMHVVISFIVMATLLLSRTKFLLLLFNHTDLWLPNRQSYVINSLSISAHTLYILDVI